MTDRACYISEEGPIRVLHVDDDACFLKTAKAILEMQGAIQVETALSVEEAVGKMKTEKYDAIVCDYQMPGKDGLQFLKELREEGNRIPFIVFTGKGREEVVINALNLGADHYENKNGNPDAVYSELSHDIINAVRTRRTEQELRIQREELQIILDSMPAKIWYKDRNNRLVRVNNTFAEYMGVSKENLEGKPLCDLFPPDIVQKCWEEDKEVITTGQPKTDILDHHESAQGVRWFSTSKVPCREKDGNIIGTINFSVDITERKKAEEALLTERDRLETVTESIGAGLAVISEDYRTLWANRVLKRIFGDVEGKICYSTYNQRSEICPRCGVREVFETGKDKAVHEQVGKDVDGKIIWSEITATPVKDKNGKVTAAVELVVPVTERKKTEEYLTESEEKFRNIFESATDVMVLSDATGRILDVNKKAVEAFGGSKGELVGRHFTRACLGIMSPTQISKVVKGFAAGLANKKPNLDVSIKNKKGQTILLECSGSLLKLGDKSTGLLVVGRDITERKRAQEELTRSEAKYRSLVEQSLQGIVIAQGPAPHLVFANAAMSRILGYTPEELTSLSPQETTGLVHPEDRDAFFGRFKDRLEGKPAPSHYEVRGIKKDGTIVWLELSSTGIEYNRYPAVQATFLNITERKKAEVALQESEERFRAIIESAPFGYYRLGKDKLWQYVNPMWERMHGLSLEEVVGKPFEITQTEDSVEQAKEYVDRALAGETITGEFSRLTSKGDVEYHSFNIQPVRRDNEIVAIEGFINDISARKKAEEALRNSEGRWRSLAEGSPDHIMLLDPKFNILYINRTVPDLKREEVIGTSLFNYVPPEWRRIAKDCFKRVVETGKTDHYDTEYRTKDGEVRFFDVRIGPVFQEDRVVAFISSSTDITSQTKAEEKLQESEQKFRCLVEEAEAYVGIIDLKGQLTYVNKALADSSGYSVQELTGRPFKDFLHPDDRGKAMRLFLKSMLLRRKTKSLEFRMIRKDGQVLHWMTKPTKLAIDGKTVGFQAIITDITERKKALERLRVLNEKLGVVGKLTRHDVRNKLSAIVGSTYLAEKALPNDHKASDYLRNIESACGEATRVLDFAAAYESLGVEGLTLVEVDKAVEEAVSLVSELKGVKVVNNCQGLTVMADSVLNQLFFNLIENSLKHGKNVSQIKVHYEEGKGILKLFYEDDGVGIPKADKPKLFNWGFTTSNGSGYGLSLIKSMMEIYGWTIEEEGEPGKGAKFVITIPNTQHAGKENSTNSKNQKNH